MKCPTCTDTTLTMADRSGIEIDYCPVCRGVWLDRGELDKIIERVSAASPPASSPPPAPRPRYDDDRHDGERRDDGRKYSNDAYPPKKKKKKSMLSELFEF